MNFLRTLLFLPAFWTQNPAFGQVAVELIKMNAVYAGLDNPVRIVVNDVPDSCLLVVLSRGEIFKNAQKEKGQYTWRLGIHDTTVVSLTIFDTTKNEKVSTYFFRFKHPPEPTPKLGKNGKGGIALVLENFDFEAKADVLSFEVVIYFNKPRNTWIFKNIGARFGIDVAYQISKLTPGDWVLFHKIVYRMPGVAELQRSSQELFFLIK